MATTSDFDRALAHAQQKLFAALKLDEIVTKPKPVDRKSLRKVSFKEMWELVHMHFDDAFSQENCWDDPNVFDLPLYLIENEPGWNFNDLEWLCDRYHNGPPHVR